MVSSKKNNIQLSEEQQVFIQKALEGKNILVDACIGSGKTTAIQHLCSEIPSDKKILYLTYNKLLKIDAKSKIKNKNATVTNYHGFAWSTLYKLGKTAGISDLIQTFIKSKPELDHYDVLIIDEYQDIDKELSQLLLHIKNLNPNIQLIAVGDLEQKIYDKTTLNVAQFMDSFLDNYTSLEFTQCFRLSNDLASKLGRIWKKNIVGANQNCIVEEMELNKVVQFLAEQKPKDILCLGSREGDMIKTLNKLEENYPETFNKKSVYASITQKGEGAVSPKKTSAIFTTFDSSKGLERKICVVFDFTESYWEIRRRQPQQKYNILRNIFCVAASRGKEHIIFVKSKNYGPLLSENTLSDNREEETKFRNMNISEMFDFKYKEDVEKCYSLLDTTILNSVDTSEIHISNHDGLIDLSPCVGIYQEAVYFKNYNIDSEIKLIDRLSKNRSNYANMAKNLSLDDKILFLTSLETRQERYRKQVETPFVNKTEKNKLVQRLSTTLSENEMSQVSCTIEFCNNTTGSTEFCALGLADVIKDEIVYELKFVSELSHENHLQCAMYMIGLGLNKGILWNTRTNKKVLITIPDKQKFLDQVSLTVSKGKLEKFNRKGRVSSGFFRSY
ncbi:AAA family ATPase [Lactococcus lactis]|uniref:AAA family ATPase n=1 Tax=Lactococcus lactis TaxID=1358 RepID=UPI0022E21458|nr:AAA family ATPase [Lactococcus lactis]